MIFIKVATASMRHAFIQIIEHIPNNHPLPLHPLLRRALATPHHLRYPPHLLPPRRRLPML